MKLFKAMATVAGMTFLSRILGFVRDMLTAIVMGAGPLADAFFVALKLPNLFRRVTAEGAFSVSFVPLFSQRIEEQGQAQAVDFARNAMGWMFVILSLFTVAAMAGMPYIIMGIAPGFGVETIQFETAVELSRVTFPYLLLISLSALLGGVLNTIGKFAAYAFAPALFNVTLICVLLTHDMIWDTPAHALAWGVFLSGFVQLIWMWVYAKRSGITLYPSIPRIDMNIKKLGWLIVPGLLGAGVYHLNLFADMIIASFLESGSISYLYYADRLQQLPLGVVGIAVGTALLPLLSRALAAKQFGEANNLFNRALESVFLLSLPAAVALMLAAEPIIKTLFNYGAFTSNDAAMTALVLQCYVVGLPAYIAARVFQSACFARQNTKTPVKIAAFGAVFNIVFALIFSRYIGVAGIALATGLSGWIQIGCLYYVLKRQGHLDFDDRLIKHFFKIILACALMGFGIYGFIYMYGEAFNMAGLMRIAMLCALVAFGGLLYIATIFALKIVSVQEIKALFKGKAKPQ